MVCQGSRLEGRNYVAVKPSRSRATHSINAQRIHPGFAECVAKPISPVFSKDEQLSANERPGYPADGCSITMAKWLKYFWLAALAALLALALEMILSPTYFLFMLWG
jgi:hypothetical protein